METKTKSKRKKHPEQFKLEAVRLLETRGERTVADVAAGLGIAESLLHSWKKKYGSAAAQVRKERGGETAEEELKRLRREMTQLKQERDILKKSVADSMGRCNGLMLYGPMEGTTSGKSEAWVEHGTEI
jgi:transposase